MASIPATDNDSQTDFSVLRTSINLRGCMIEQILNGVHYGTGEVRNLLLSECDIILECKVCKNLFRSLPNFVAHKRIYCNKPHEKCVSCSAYEELKTVDKTDKVTETSKETVITVEPTAPDEPSDKINARQIYTLEELKRGTFRGRSREFKAYTKFAEKAESQRSKSVPNSDKDLTISDSTTEIKPSDSIPSSLTLQGRNLKGDKNSPAKDPRQPTLDELKQGTLCGKSKENKSLTNVAEQRRKKSIPTSVKDRRVPNSDTDVLTVSDSTTKIKPSDNIPNSSTLEGRNSKEDKNSQKKDLRQPALDELKQGTLRSKSKENKALTNVAENKRESRRKKSNPTSVKDRKALNSDTDVLSISDSTTEIKPSDNIPNSSTLEGRNLKEDKNSPTKDSKLPVLDELKQGTLRSKSKENKALINIAEKRESQRKKSIPTSIKDRRALNSDTDVLSISDSTTEIKPSDNIPNSSTLEGRNLKEDKNSPTKDPKQPALDELKQGTLRGKSKENKVLTNVAEKRESRRKKSIPTSVKDRRVPNSDTDIKPVKEIPSSLKIEDGAIKDSNISAAVKGTKQPADSDSLKRRSLRRTRESKVFTNLKEKSESQSTKLATPKESQSTNPTTSEVNNNIESLKQEIKKRPLRNASDSSVLSENNEHNDGAPPNKKRQRRVEVILSKHEKSRKVISSKAHNLRARTAVKRGVRSGKDCARDINIADLNKYIDIEKHLCLLCKTSFATKSSLRVHMTYTHSSAEQYPCPVCHQDFKYTWNVIRHLIIKHKKTKKQADKIRIKMKKAMESKMVQADVFMNSDVTHMKCISSSPKVDINQAVGAETKKVADKNINSLEKVIGSPRLLVENNSDLEKSLAAPQFRSGSTLHICSLCNTAFWDKRRLELHREKCGKLVTIESQPTPDHDMSGIKTKGLTGYSTDVQQVKELIMNSAGILQVISNATAVDSDISSGAVALMNNSSGGSASKIMPDSPSVAVSHMRSGAKYRTGSARLPRVSSGSVKQPTLSLMDTVDENMNGKDTTADGVVHDQNEEMNVTNEPEINEVEEVWVAKEPGKPIRKVRSGRAYVMEDISYRKTKCQDLKQIASVIDENKLLCLKCNTGMNSLSNLRRHAIRHLGWKRYKCKVCRFSCYNRSEMKRHVGNAHGKKVSEGGGKADNFITDLMEEAGRVRAQKKLQTLCQKRRLPTTGSDFIVTYPKGTSRMTFVSPLNDRRKPGVNEDNILDKTVPVNKFNISTRNSPRAYDTAPLRQVDKLDTMCTRRGYYVKPPVASRREESSDASDSEEEVVELVLSDNPNEEKSNADCSLNEVSTSVCNSDQIVKESLPVIVESIEPSKLHVTENENVVSNGVSINEIIHNMSASDESLIIIELPDGQRIICDKTATPYVPSEREPVPPVTHAIAADVNNKSVFVPFSNQQNDGSVASGNQSKATTSQFNTSVSSERRIQNGDQSNIFERIMAGQTFMSGQEVPADVSQQTKQFSGTDVNGNQPTAGSVDVNSINLGGIMDIGGADDKQMSDVVYQLINSESLQGVGRPINFVQDGNKLELQITQPIVPGYQETNNALSTDDGIIPAIYSHNTSQLSSVSHLTNTAISSEVYSSNSSQFTDGIEFGWI